MKLLDREVTSMNEENNTQVESQDNTAVVENQENNVESNQGQQESTPKVENPASFTQEQVNNFVRARLEKYENSLYKRYGVENKEGLNELFGKAQSYSVMEERYNNQKVENATLREENAFLKNKINPQKYDDIRAYFKGKGLEFTEDALINELTTHGEWLSVDEVKSPLTTIKAVGTDPKMNVPQRDEKAEASRLFGLKNLI